MKLRAGRSVLTFILAVIAVSVSAQKDVKKYKEESETFRKEIWGWEKPEFNVRAIPAEFDKSSRVVIARHIEITSDSKKKTKFVGLGFAVYRELTHTEIFREMVKINDKSAVTDYSEFSYTQLQRRSGGFISNTSSVYIGVKVIKPDGKMREINADDIVLTKDEKSEKEAKVAVPDLQVGDFIDYYIAKQTNMSGLGSIPPYAFTLFDDYPIMSYSIHCEIGKKYAVEYHSYNKAPEFKHMEGEGGVNIFDVKKQNIPAYTESSLWVSPYRQLPIIRMNIILGYSGLYAKRMNTRKPGEVYKNQSFDEFLQDEKVAISNQKIPNAKSMFMLKDNSDVPEIASDYFKKIQKNKEDIPADSLAAELFYIYRFSNFLDIYADMNIEAIIKRNYRDVNSSQYMYNFGDFLKLADIDNQLVFVTPKNGPVLKEIMSSQDIHYLLQVQGRKQRFFGIDDIFSLPYYIPPQYENTKQAITLDTKGRKTVKPKDFEEGITNVPGTKAQENTRIEKMSIVPAADGSGLQVSRKTILRGHYKSDEQKRLILVEDYCNAERKVFGASKTIIEELQDGKKSKKYADELKTAFDQARSKNKDAFLAETKDWFEQEITELSDFKVENLGVRHTSPDFVYSSKFKMGGVVKKAGNNFIVEVGKLQGSPLKVSEDQRKRKLDVYMPFARSFQTVIELQIPDGYTAEGVQELNKSVENETGYFITEAATDGKMVTIKLKKSYNNAFEPVANWEKLLAFIDAANEWTNTKILLKKK